MALIRTANERKAVQAWSFPGGNEHLLVRKMPAVGDIALLANMAFIAIEKVKESIFRQLLQLCKAFDFVSI
jgi:hypothetical protein